MKFNEAGIKRWITKIVSNLYYCNNCKKSFTPNNYKRGGYDYIPKNYRVHRTKYGHNLKSWVIYQHIFNQMSFRKIEEYLYEFHSLQINKTTLHEFKKYIFQLL